MGHAIRRARIARGLTQAALAKTAGLSRVTLNRLEMGTFPDLGANKLQALLENVGLTLAVQPAPKPHRPDFLRLATTTASVSFKEPLTEAELIRALLSGKVPRGKKPHFRLLLEEASPSMMRGLLREVSLWTKPGKVEKSLAAIAREVGATEPVYEWSKIV
ncbi:helix-turn-helix transcriptional regulator [Methyloceanibacter sp.]|uniref:helix-turn-helix transcriptional regulator n=1 Tax=Methyloceanibacter sp. TaxID=1965321 RepID=UPI003D6D5232